MGGTQTLVERAFTQGTEEECFNTITFLLAQGGYWGGFPRAVSIAVGTVVEGLPTPVGRLRVGGTEQGEEEEEVREVHSWRC